MHLRSFEGEGARLTSKILHGDCLVRLKALPANSVDSLVTDPPAGISFMGKDWDHHKGGRDQWIAWLESVMRECLRVMKPGAHGLVWALPRTSHWTATALENAGFEVRDVVTHLFGSGFPKSLDVSKAIDKAAGAKRKVVGHKGGRYNSPGSDIRGGSYVGGKAGTMTNLGDITAPATDAAKRWQGFGTALKPASEHWILIRKPISEKTVAANVQRFGTGALNIDGCRIRSAGGTKAVNFAKKPCGRLQRWDEGSKGARNKIEALPLGRWPANLLLSPEAAAELDRQSGVSKSHPIGAMRGGDSPNRKVFGNFGGKPHSNGYGDSGGASRFFYCAKPSKSERGNGNTHPTVKSIRLMRYLIRMVTPPGGLVLDAFAGSGTTGCAAKREGFRFIGIEREREYVSISRARIKAVA
jgi:site-specific DNA-methyltransferase (adenine-specific)